MSTGLEIHGTDDDPLYQTQRCSLDGEFSKLAYRIPLVPGRYRITLHFAEIWDEKRMHENRLIYVKLENQPVLEGYEPLQAGFATADRKSFEIQVEDGFLDLELIPRRDHPILTAIEVEPLR